MIEPLFIITNNPLSHEKFKDEFEVMFIDGDVEEVYRAVRDKIHMGHRLLTHPLMSSIKPNETPYRTICITAKKVQGIDFDSVNLIENSILTLHKFLNISALPKYSEEIMYDFQVIDHDLIHHALN